MEAAKEKIKAFLSQFFRNRELDDDSNIFALGFVNSLLAMQLVMFVEKEFDITIENEDLDLENFSSVNAIINLVERKKSAQALSFA
jgi:acyl carrier protein